MPSLVGHISHAKRIHPHTSSHTSDVSTSCLLLSQLHAYRLSLSLYPDNSIEKCSTCHFVCIECKSVLYACSSQSVYIEWGTNNNNDNIFAGQGSALLQNTSSTYDSTPYWKIVVHTCPFLHEPLLHITKKPIDTTQKSHSAFKRIYSPVVAALLRTESVSFTSLDWKCSKDEKENIWKAKKRRRETRKKKINWFRRRKRCLHFVPLSVSIHRRASIRV